MEKISIYNQFTSEDTIHSLGAMSAFEDKIYQHLLNRDYRGLEASLNEFGQQIIILPEHLQMLEIKYVFTKIIVILSHRIQHHINMKDTMMINDMVKKLEAWETLSEFLLGIPWFVKQIENISQTNPMTMNKYVDEAIHLIQLHLTEKKLTVFWLASEIGITTVHLNNLFKIELGYAVSSYIKDRKIKEIMYDLKQCHLSLKDVREKYGFKNPSYFSQFFKKETSQTPLEFMKQ